MKHAHKHEYEAPTMTVIGRVEAFTFQGSVGGTFDKGGTKNDQNVSTNKV